MFAPTLFEIVYSASFMLDNFEKNKIHWVSE